MIDTEQDEQAFLDGLEKKMRGKDMLRPYRTTHATRFTPDSRYGWMSFPILELFWGLPLRNWILAYVQAFRPSAIRITAGETTADSYLHRVTIRTYTDENGIERIKDIEQELSIGFACAYDVNRMRQYIENCAAKPVAGKPTDIIDINCLKKVNF